MADPATESLSRAIAGRLLAIGAVSLRPAAPFTWASGLKSPIYCDNRLTMAFPEVRDALADGFVELVLRNGLTVEAVVGTATAGIPHATLLADRLGLPLAYVRSAPKAHGQGKRVEGRVDQGQAVVVVEDLVSTGESSIRVVEALREEGAQVLAVLAIFTYGLPQSVAAFSSAGLPLHTLTDYATLVKVAAEQNQLDPGALDTLHDWQKDPAAWSRSRESAGT